MRGENFISLNMECGVCRSMRPITDSVGFLDTRRRVSKKKFFSKRKVFTKFSGFDLVQSQVFPKSFQEFVTDSICVDPIFKFLNISKAII